MCKIPGEKKKKWAFPCPFRLRKGSLCGCYAAWRYTAASACSTLRGRTPRAISEVKDHKCCWRSGLEGSGADRVDTGFNASVIILGSRKMELVHRKKKRRALVSGVNRRSLEMGAKRRSDLQQVGRPPQSAAVPPPAPACTAGPLPVPRPGVPGLGHSPGNSGSKAAVTPGEIPWILGITRDAHHQLQHCPLLPSQPQPLPKKHLLSPISPKFEGCPGQIYIFFHSGLRQWDLWWP